MRQEYCKQEKRRRLVSDGGVWNGIDYLEVLDFEADAIGSPRQRTLLVYCLKTLDPSISAANVEIRGGVRVKGISVEWVVRADDADDLLDTDRINTAEHEFFETQPDPDRVLVVRTSAYGDFSTYRLSLVSGDAPLAGFDPPLAEVDFWFKVECPTDFDCAAPQVCPPVPEIIPPIDYLSRDYASFRQLLLDRLSVVAPDWTDRSVADIGVAIVEVLAHAADHLSYFQDAVATEAYLDTARRRPSVRRHARLLDYAMHDGCNARTWVAVQAAEGVRNVLLPIEYQPGSTTLFMTGVPGQDAQIAAEDVEEIVAEYAPAVFEPLFEIRLFHAHNKIHFHTWGDEQCCLPQGATRATLVDSETDRLCLCPGDVLIFAEVRSPQTGDSLDADPTRRHAVRLARVDPAAEVDADGVRTAGPLRLDEVLGSPIVEIEWAVEDALPFPLCLSTEVEKSGVVELVSCVSLALGNVVLADHGRRIADEILDVPTGTRTYRPQLAEPDLTQAMPFPEEAWNSISTTGEEILAASEMLAQSPRLALPVIVELKDAGGLNWTPRRDLLSSDAFDTVFVVEVENGGLASLRFGDGVYGMIPEAGVTMTASYRVGNGTAGNVGADSIYHFVTTPGLGIDGVANPLQAVGGTDPESLAEVRLYAPQAFRTQERAVTEEDYAVMAQRHQDVDRAVAQRRWTGSWHTMFVTVDRKDGRTVDSSFEERLREHLDRYKLAPHDVEITPPVFVPLEIALRICVKPGHLQTDVELELLDVFSNRDLSDGRRGFFHPDNLSFGEAVYLSRIIAAAMNVEGVQWVDMDTEASPPAQFQRWGRDPHGEIEQGYIDVGRFEIAQLDNDPNAPENGQISFHLDGGL